MDNIKTSPTSPVPFENNLDPEEAKRFNQMAATWWNPDGPCRPLHDLNPVRLQYIERFMSLEGKQVLDIGCGGGLLSEALAKKGAKVMALDIAEDALNVAKQHQAGSALGIDYRLSTAEQHCRDTAQVYDAVVCMELLEHVPNPASLMSACRQLLKPDGHVFLSTLQRTPKAYFRAILGAEYLLKLLPVGTHDYAKFIRPSELCAWGREVGLRIDDLTGMDYNPFTRKATVSRKLKVNYLAHAVLD